ncbi:hypothetical protein UB45_11850 [Terrabacter sp. 28]|nr:hypothetical protein UB45_11850 [Terrabacter sp. 28]
MYTADSIAWAEAFGVHQGFVDRALQQRLRRLQDTEEELRSLYTAFRDVPDEELLLSIRSATRSMSQAVECLQIAIRQMSRGSA